MAHSRWIKINEADNKRLIDKRVNHYRFYVLPPSLE